MSPDDPRHGTTAGHYAHRRAGEKACAPCVAAKTRYEKTRAVYGDRLVPAIGTRRRIQALKAMGYSGADIAARLGVTYQAVHKLERGTSPRVQAATAAKVQRVFEEMCMVVPTGYHAKRIRNQSAARGYAPPLAYDNLDDPNETPRNWQYVGYDREAVLADLDHRGESLTAACHVLGISPDGVERWCQRHGHNDLYRRLVERERPHRWANQYGEGGAA